MFHAYMYGLGEAEKGKVFEAAEPGHFWGHFGVTLGSFWDIDVEWQM